MRWTGNGIGAEGARIISEALKINSTLTKLDLGCGRKKKRTKKVKRLRSEDKINWDEQGMGLEQKEQKW